MNQKEKIIWAAIAALYIFMIFVSVQSTFRDDLSFDFIGYTVRYQNLFTSWLSTHHLGLPAGVFDGALPGALPFAFWILGIGAATLPLAIAILLLRLLAPFVFAWLGKKFGISRQKGILLGLIFVLNPITFKFFNRYYEFFSWLLMLGALASFYALLEEKKFNKKMWALSSVLLALAIYSHTAPVFLAGIAFVFLLRSKEDLKRLVLVGALAGLLAAGWIVPFALYNSWSAVSAQVGFELVTTGIQYASAFLFVCLAAAAFLLHRSQNANPRLFQWTALNAVLALVILVAPWIPILNKPFIHSYHVLFLANLLIVVGVLLKGKMLSKKIWATAGAACIVVLFLAAPIVYRQYVFEEFNFSQTPYNSGTFGNNIQSFSQVDVLLKEIPKTERYEVLPPDSAIVGYGSVHYGLDSLNGWGYNAYAPAENIELERSMTSMQLPCTEFLQDANKTFTRYWIALSPEAFSYLQKCGLTARQQSSPVIFTTDEKISFVENGKLLEKTGERILFEANPPYSIVKENWFPRWKAFAGGKELKVEDAHPGMLVRVSETMLVTLEYEWTSLEWVAFLLQIAGMILLVTVLFLKRSARNGKTA
ncbi:MAG: hypothetical protein V1847_00945 [Candidatus Diapherotrites archaeon]